MTGEKNRYSSVEKLWELDDSTLKTPKHDEMVIWLLNSENAASVIPEVYTFLNETDIRIKVSDGNIFLKYCADFWQRLKDKEKTLKDQELINLGSISKKEISDNFDTEMRGSKEEVYEYINEKTHLNFSESTKAIIKDEYIWYGLCSPQGYFDEVTYGPLLYATEKVGIQRRWENMIAFYHAGNTRFREESKRKVILKSEVPLMASNNFLAGYWDIVISPSSPEESNEFFSFSWKSDSAIPKLYIEVKPRIDSFGATLRQLRTYQEYVSASVGNTYLFTDDLRFKEAFESQGIQVISREKTEEGDREK